MFARLTTDTAPHLREPDYYFLDWKVAFIADLSSDGGEGTDRKKRIFLEMQSKSLNADFWYHC